MDELRITAGELRMRLADHDDDKIVAVYAEGGQGGVPIEGIDSYEDAIVLIPATPLREGQ